MLHRHPARLGLMLLLLLGLTACEDNPTGVGLNIDSFSEESGDPHEVIIPADSFEVTTIDDLVGNRTGIMVGASGVPTAYTFTATGYVDFLTTSRSEEFRDGSVASAVLYLEPSYVYGDSTSTVTFELYALTDELESTGATNDTTISVSGNPVEITSVEGQNATVAGNKVSFVPTDTLLAIRLGPSWIDAHDAALRSDEFADDFHGFQLRPIGLFGAGAISGTQANDISLEIVSAEDTVSFKAGRVVSNQVTTAPNFTKFERTTTYDPGQTDQLLVQDGLGTTFNFDIELPDSVVGASSLNRGNLTFTTDTTLFDAPTMSFAQAPLTRFYLLGIDEQGNKAYLAEATVNSSGKLIFSTRTNSDLYGYLRGVLLGSIEPFVSYQLALPSAVHTVNYQVFYTSTDEADKHPSLSLTFIPND